MESANLKIASLAAEAVGELQDGVSIPVPVTRVHKFKDLWLNKDYIQKFLIENLVPSGAVSILIGDDGIGKTQLLTSLGLAVAFGEPTWLNQKLNAQNKGCMIVATEDSKQKFTGAMVKQVNQNFSKHLSKNPDPNFFFMEGADYDDWGEFCAEIEKNVVDNGLGLVVIDALSDLFGLVNGDINDNSVARKIIKRLQSITDRHEDLSIVVIHHAAKTKILAKHREKKIFVEKFDSQGAGAITQKARTVLALSNDPRGNSADTRTTTNYLHVVKANLMGKRFVKNAIRLEFDTWNLTHKFSGEVDIELMEAEVLGEEGQEEVKKAEKGPSYEDHVRIVGTVFPSDDVFFDRAALVDELVYAYAVGKQKITNNKNGFLKQLLENNLIQETEKGFKKTYTPERISTFNMPLSAEFEIKPTDDEPPF